MLIDPKQDETARKIIFIIKEHVSRHTNLSKIVFARRDFNRHL